MLSDFRMKGKEVVLVVRLCGILIIGSGLMTCDLPLRGVEFTWSNMLECLVMSQLDRFLVSTEWLDLFPDCTLQALAQLISDHCPLLLEIGMEDWGPLPFKFEIMWLSK